MKRHENLEQLLAHIWSTIQQGVKQPEHPYHASGFATVGKDGPRVRTVILRAFDLKTRALIFHSDHRAQKVQEIQHNTRVSWLLWNAQTKEQLRLRGKASLHSNDQLAEKIWYDSHPKSLKLYVKPTSPTTQIDAPHSGISEEVATIQLDNHQQVATGRKNFTAICTRIDEVDFLHLHSEGNYRARFTWDSQGVKSAWIIP